MTPLLLEDYSETPTSAWLPMHKSMVQNERLQSPIRPHTVYNVAGNGPKQSLYEWENALRSTFTDLVPELSSPSQFNGMIETVECADLLISRITAKAQKVHRGIAEIEKSSTTKIYLNIHLNGAGKVLHSSGTTNLSIGDCILVDSRQPYVLEFGSSFRQLCLQLPEWGLREQLDAPLETVLGQPFSLHTPKGKVLLSALELILLEANTENSDAEAANLFMQVINLNLNETARDLYGADWQHSANTGLAIRLRQYIGNNFRDESTSPVDAAATLGCSLRNVHKTCQGMATTFGKLVLDARLSAAAQALASTAPSRARITDIAFDSGFSDISHFCKVFRARFGVAPTEFRKQRL